MRTVAAVAALLGATDAYTLTSCNRPATRASMGVIMSDDLVPMNPVWNDPREGKPFGDADRDPATGLRKVGGVRQAVEAYTPRGLSDATVIKPQYIDTDDDEPWHATSRQTIVVGKAELDKGYEATLPFLAAEDALGDATRAAKDAKAIKAAIEAALKANARPGSPAVVAAEKVMAAFEKGDEKAAEKAKPKAPKVGAQGKGWDDMARALGKTHDNSVA